MNRSALYFCIVFLVGFAFGTLRILILVPSVGEQTAELIELPFMIAVCFWAARYIVYASSTVINRPQALCVGGLALLYLLVFEFSLVLWLRDLSLLEYMQTKYSISGVAYAMSLILYGVFPYLIVRLRKT
ncbi:hypothetical protein NBRC116495_32880 [Aurantivibrio plasticivorans]